MAHLRRVLGLILLLSLPMALATGVAAQGGSDSEPITVVLLDESGQFCGVDLSTGSGGLGTWQMQNGVYTNTATTSTVEIVVTVYSAAPNGCDITFGFNGLTGPQGEAIGAEYFTLTVASLSLPLELVLANQSLIASMLENAAVGTVSMFLMLESVPATLTPGLYTGSIDVTIADAA